MIRHSHTERGKKPANELNLARRFNFAFPSRKYTNLAKRMSKKDSEKKANRSLRMKAFISKSAKENHACEHAKDERNTKITHNDKLD